MTAIVFFMFYSVPLVLGATRETEDRIVGGYPILIESRPYQLTFLFQGSFICGAVLITKDAALTAAHCIKLTSPDPWDFTVRAGSSFSWFGGIVMDVEEVIPHPKYVQFDYDIAVIRLTRSLTLSRRIQPIAISNIGGDSLAGKTVEVSGWGVTIPFIPQSTSFILQETTLIVVKKSICKQTAGYEFLTDRMLCAKGVRASSDSCQGDSGGPLVWKDKLVGLVSFGKGCADGTPGVYTDVTKFPDFIKKHTSAMKLNKKIK